MLATECSKPEMMKSMIGKTMARILPWIVLAEKANQTARQTRILQSIPRIRAGQKARLVLVMAVAIAESPSRPPL